MNKILFFLFCNMCSFVFAQNPSAQFRCYAFSPDTGSYLGYVLFEDLSADSGGYIISVHWDFGDPASGTANNSTAHFPVHHYSVAGFYTVTFIATDNVGEIDTLISQHCIYVDSTMCTCSSPSGVGSIWNESFEITLVPNPFHAYTTVHIIGSTDRGNSQLKIYTPLGSLVREQTITNQESSIINRDGLPNGLYFYELTTSSHLPLGKGKFVIE